MISDTDCVKHAPTAVGENTSSAYSDKDQPSPPIILMPSRDHDSLFSGGGIRYLLLFIYFYFKYYQLILIYITNFKCDLRF